VLEGAKVPPLPKKNIIEKIAAPCRNFSYAYNAINLNGTFYNPINKYHSYPVLDLANKNIYN